MKNVDNLKNESKEEELVEITENLKEGKVYESE